MSEITLKRNGNLEEFHLTAKIDYSMLRFVLEAKAKRKTEVVELMIQRIDEAKKYLDKMKDDLKEI
tara:strand:- start:91 stop:288 length:198 start_codon:yes stop_codon:yes gene_type:complete